MSNKTIMHWQKQSQQPTQKQKQPDMQVTEQETRKLKPNSILKLIM